MNTEYRGSTPERDPILDPPIYTLSSHYLDNWTDPSLGSKFGFQCSALAIKTQEPMVIIADFGRFTRIKEVIFCKRGDSEYYYQQYVISFRLSYESNNEWIEHGVYETGLTD